MYNDCISLAVHGNGHKLWAYDAGSDPIDLLHENCRDECLLGSMCIILNPKYVLKVVISLIIFRAFYVICN